MSLQNSKVGLFERIFAVLTLINGAEYPLHFSDIKKYSQNDSRGLAYSIDAILQLINFIGWIQINKMNIVKKTNKFPMLLIENNDQNTLQMQLVKYLLVNLREKNQLSEFIPYESLDYDTSANCVRILNNFMPLSYSVYKNLLISLGFFQYSTPKYYFYIGKKFEQVFEEEVIDWYNKKQSYIPGMGITYDEFLEMQKEREEFGFKAEEYVLNLEKKRLSNHPYIKNIVQISRYKVNAGFDIASYENENSKSLDRFIEVKSYIGTPHFYISRNEIETAERLGDKYYLYLVSRDLINTDNGAPLIYKNAYVAILSKKTKWHCQPVSWFYSHL